MNDSDHDRFPEPDEPDVRKNPPVTIVARRRRNRRERLFAVLPTMLTLGNAFCGFAAITYAARVGPDLVDPAETHLLAAAVCIYLAMLFDALDGRAARWANQTSEFGAQLDSLCDAISFGVAPAFLMRQFAARGDIHSRILWMIGALYVACAILRLARFNVETDDDDSHDSFSGLPSPAAGGVVASFPIAQYGLEKLLSHPRRAESSFAQTAIDWLRPILENSLPLFTLGVACLMVSRIRYAHVFNQMFSGRKNRGHLIQIVFTVAVVFIVRELAVPVIFLWFAFASPLRAFWSRVMKPKLHRTDIQAEAVDSTSSVE